MGILDTAVDPSKGPSPRYPKVLLWGKEGVAKTVTALFIAKHFGLRLFGIDADGGLGAYQNDEFWRDHFRYIYAESPVSVVTAFNELLDDPRDYGMALLDPVSTVYKDTQHKVEAEARTSAANKGNQISEFSNALHKGSWGPIKRWNFFMMQRIRRLQMPLVVTAREANKWGNDTVVGIKPDCEDSVPHEFDITIHLTQQGDLRVATVSKDRWHTLPTRMESSWDDPFWVARALIEAYGSLWCETPRAKPMAENDQVKQLYDLQDLLGLDSVIVLKRLRGRYGADGFEELTPAQAGELITILRESGDNDSPQGDNPKGTSNDQ